MKFTSSQLNFLMSYLSLEQVDEIKSFSADIPLKEKCEFVKKNGEQCKKNKKDGSLCPVHSKPFIEKHKQEPCETIKENGDRCSFKVKKDGKCGLHLKKVRVEIEDDAISEELGESSE